MKVEIYAEEWMICMGMVGLKRLLKEDIELTEFGISFNINVLEKLPEAFFEYMIDEFDIAERDYKRLIDNFKFAAKNERFQQGLKQIKETMNGQLKKVTRYFQGQTTEIQLKKIIGSVKEIKQFEQYEQLEEYIGNYYNIMKTQEINEKLTMNYFKTVIMRSFYGQPSFLNVSKNSLTKKEQINLFFEDYVKPVILEACFKEQLIHNQDPQKIKAFLQENKDHKPFNNILKAIKKKTSFDEIQKYVSEIPRCTFFDSQLATTNFEEMVFSPLGITGVAFNFNWNLESKQPIPISVLAKLILFLVPVGVAFYNRKDGFETQGEYRTYAGFVMSDQKFTEIYRMNESFKNKKKDNNPFDEIVYSLLQDTQERAKYIVNNLFFLEVYSDYSSKKTLLDYYHMPSYTAEYFQRFGHNLKFIYPRELREAFTRFALKGIDPKEIVFRCLQVSLKQNTSGIGGYIATREMNRIQSLRKGVSNMSNDDKRVYVVFKQGQVLRDKLVKEGEDRAASSKVYTASGGKKINAIAYRLLNAAKTGSKKSFMDTLFRIHMAANQEVSSIFLNVLHEKNLSFEVVSSAFIAGLLSEEYKDQEVEVNE